MHEEDPAQDSATNELSVVTKLTDLIDQSTSHHNCLVRFYEDFCGYLKDDDDSLFSSPNTSPKSSASNPLIVESPMTSPMTPLSPRKHSSNQLLKRKRNHLTSFVDFCLSKKVLSVEFIIDLAKQFHSEISVKDNRYLLKSFKESFTGKDSTLLISQIIKAETIVESNNGFGLSQSDEIRLFSQCFCQILLNYKFIFHMTHKKQFKDSNNSFYGLCKNLKQAESDFRNDYSAKIQTPSTPTSKLEANSSHSNSFRKSISLALSLNLKKVHESKEVKEAEESEDEYDEHELPIGYIRSARASTSSSSSSPIVDNLTPPNKSHSFNINRKSRRNTLMLNQLIIPKLNFNNLMNHESEINSAKSTVVEISEPFEIQFSVLNRNENPIPNSKDSDEELFESPRRFSFAKKTPSADLPSTSRRSSLSEFLRDTYMREQFKTFSKDEYSQENIIFYEEVLKFLNSIFLSEEEQRALALKLYQLFIPSTSVYQLNLPSKLLAKFKDEFDTDFDNVANVVLLYKEALTEIEHVMKDTYTRFKMGKEYQKYKLRMLNEDDGFTTSRY
ncbi:predicted protein [Naegleria gruberi]|uniref:Predicted protein n=1 Tax=Naegleria gruberi TaxID=5762 RepID=D2VYX8_NAEGR|nr:uncharacterized protein NAEGRDRAFT_74281 [Naegleria gruberi]EFC38031.1 predicted protein [Naegleria gruberi]|eukprot:XP_002670775.1 predicted protein [Naegleria gruberi strain NEG-M]